MSKTHDWPWEIKHDGRTLGRTGKTGTNTRTGLPAAEYAYMRADGRESGHRAWLLADGTKESD